MKRALLFRLLALTVLLALPFAAKAQTIKFSDYNDGQIGDVYVGQYVKYDELSFEAEGVTEDIVVTCDNSNVTFLNTTIPVEDLTGSWGSKSIKLEIRINCTEAGAGQANIQLTSGGENVGDPYPISWTAQEAEFTGTIADMRRLAGKNVTYIKSLAVSYVETVGTKQTYYFQDETGGVKMTEYTEYGPAYKAGDRISGLVGKFADDKLVFNFHDGFKSTCPPAVSNSDVTPKTVTLGELAAMKDDPLTYTHMLVAVENATVASREAGEEASPLFETDGLYLLTDGTADAQALLSVSKLSGIAGLSLPTAPIKAVGIASYNAQEQLPAIAPRLPKDVGSDIVYAGSIADVRNYIINQLDNATTNSMYFTLTEEAIVTRADKAAGFPPSYTYYLQDATGAIQMEQEMAFSAKYKVGDKVLPGAGSINNIEGVYTFVPRNPSEFPPALSSGNDVTPFSTDIPGMTKALKSDPLAFESRLIELDGITFTDQPAAFGKDSVAFTDITASKRPAAYINPAHIEGENVPAASDPLKERIRLRGYFSWGQGAKADAYIITPMSIADIRAEVIPAYITVTDAQKGQAGIIYSGTSLSGYAMTVKAEGLEAGQNIAIAIDAEEVTCDVASITREEAAAGKAIAFSITPAEKGQKTATVTFTSGETVQTATISWECKDPDAQGTIAEVRQYIYDELDGKSKGKVFRLTGDMTVTHVKETDGFFFKTSTHYLQDESGAIVIKLTSAAVYKAGDKVTGLLGTITSPADDAFGAQKYHTFAALNDAYPAPVSSGNAITPKAVTLKEMQEAQAANQYAYEHMLVTLDDVVYEAGGATNFAKDVPVIFQDQSEAKGMVVTDNIVDEAIPNDKAQILSLTGLATGYDADNGFLITPRSKDDLTARTRPVPSITLTGADDGELGEAETGSTIAYTLHVTAENLTEEVVISSTNAALSFAPASLTPEQAHAGADIAVTVTVSEEGAQEAEVAATSGNVPAAVLILRWEGVKPNGICQPAGVAFDVWCQDHTVTVLADGLQRIEAYTLTGMKLASVEGRHTIDLPAGAYLLRVATAEGEGIQKVIVR